MAVASVAAAGLAVTAKLVLNLLRGNKNSGKLNLSFSLIPLSLPHLHCFPPTVIPIVFIDFSAHYLLLRRKEGRIKNH